MNKKNYMTPNTEVINLNVKSHLLDASIVNVHSSDSFTQDIEVGGNTTGADSRGSIWDDEDDDY
jgi:hypothetical protein